MELVATQRFEIVRQLGEGGMGVVYQAVDRETGATVALKTLRNPDPQALYRLKQEFRSLADLRHPNLVSLGELHEDGGRWFFTMELVVGCDLITYLSEGATPERASLERDDTQRLPRVGISPAPVSPHAFDGSRLRSTFAQLVGALQTLHQAGKVHRDIKPSNVLVTDAERVVLLDFGLVAELEPGDQSLDGGLVGTAAYMAPEQAAAHRVGPEADWYAVGGLLYEALTGRPPFRGAPLEVLVDKQQMQPRPVRAVNPRAPSDLADLCEALLAFAPEERPDGDEVLRRLRGAKVTAGVAGPVSGLQRGCFVGRKAELASLEASYAEMLGGRTTGLVVCGESGVGKTALIRTFVHGLVGKNPPSIVLSGRCYQSETVPFKAVDGVIDAISRLLRRLDEVEVARLLPQEASLLPRVFPVLGRVPQIARARRVRRPEKDAHELRTRVFAALRELFQRLASWLPLVVTIDDLQWADADSLWLLRGLVAAPDPPPLLLLATLRRDSGQDSARRAWATLDLPGGIRELTLSQLEPDDARELAALLLDRAGTQGAEPERIAREANGHPLYIDELVRHLAATAGGQAPVRLDQAIWQRITTLAPAARRIVELVAVAAAPVTVDVIRYAADHEAAEFPRLVAILRVSNLIRAVSGRDDDAIEPYHDRVREAVTGNLSPDQLTGHHRSLAAALEQAGLADQLPELLVHHLEGAGEGERAAEYAERAAARAVDLLAFERVAALYRTRLRIGATDPTHQRRLQRALGSVLASAGRCEQAAQALLAGGDDDDRSIRLECHIQAAEQLLISGHIERGMEVLASLLGEMGIALPANPSAALRSLLWRRLELRLRGCRWRPRTPAQIAPEVLLQIDLLKAISNGMSMVDTIVGAEFNARFLLAALRAGENNRIAAALASEAVYASSQGGSFARGRKLARILAELAERDQNQFLAAYGTTIDAVVDYFAGDFPRAADKLGRAVAELDKTPVAAIFEVNNSRLFFCFTLRHLGAFVSARRRFAEYLDDAVARGDRYLETSLRRTVTLICLADDDSAAAHDHLARATWVPPEKRFHVQHWYELEAMAELALYEDRAASARDELAPLFAALWGSMTRRVQIIRSLAMWLEGRLILASREEERPGDRTTLARLIRKLSREKVPYARGWSHLLRAGSLVRDEQRAAAEVELERAIAIADSTGMNAIVAAARLRLGELASGQRAAELTARALDWYAEQEVRAPERLAALYVPRFARVEAVGAVGAGGTGGAVGGEGRR